STFHVRTPTPSTLWVASGLPLRAAKTARVQSPGMSGGLPERLHAWARFPATIGCLSCGSLTGVSIVNIGRPFVTAKPRTNNSPAIRCPAGWLLSATEKLAAQSSGPPAPKGQPTLTAPISPGGLRRAPSMSLRASCFFSGVSQAEPATRESMLALRTQSRTVTAKAQLLAGFTGHADAVLAVGDVVAAGRPAWPAVVGEATGFFEPPHAVPKTATAATMKTAATNRLIQRLPGTGATDPTSILFKTPDGGNKFQIETEAGHPGYWAACLRFWPSSVLAIRNGEAGGNGWKR